MCWYLYCHISVILTMSNQLDAQMMRSLSKYQSNIDHIAEKYCNAPNRRELALQTLQRDFGQSSTLLPAVDSENENYKLVCQRLNEVKIVKIYFHI